MADDESAEPTPEQRKLVEEYDKDKAKRLKREKRRRGSRKANGTNDDDHWGV